MPPIKQKKVDEAVKNNIENMAKDQGARKDLVNGAGVFAGTDVRIRKLAGQVMADKKKAGEEFIAHPLDQSWKLPPLNLLETSSENAQGGDVEKNAKIIQQELIALGREFSRYQDRWDKLSRNIDSVNKSVKDIHVTSNKIGKRFEEISHVELELEEPEDEE